MPRKKIVESISGVSSSHVLIIAGSLLGSKLSQRLIQKGCTVKQEENPGVPVAGRYDYIFQFGHDISARSHFHANLVSGGKFLLITQHEDVEADFPITILRIGEKEAWDEEKLLDTIMRTMFRLAREPIIDLRRGSRKKVLSMTIDSVHSIHELPSIPSPVSSSKKIPIQTPPRIVKHHRFIIGRKIFIFVFILLVAVLLFGTGFFYVLKVKRVYSSFRTHIAASQWQESLGDIHEAQTYLSQGKNIYHLSSGPLFFLVDWEPYQNIGSLLTTTETLLTSTEDIITTSIDISSQRKSGFGGVSETNFRTLHVKLTTIAKTLTDARAEINKVSFAPFPKQDIDTLLASSSNKLNSALSIMPFIEKIFLRSEAQTYLLLFQNNMELRPTGGFIGSFALVIVKNGEVSNFKIEDVYTADGQLKGHVDPPLPIRKYLNQPHFFLRDSNFDPDFAQSGAKASWFLEKEIGVKVDGVVAVNSSFLQKLLTVTGGLTLADFGGEQVTADNFFLKSYNLVQNNFFAGSTQKKDFLTAVAQGLRFRVESDPSIWFDLLPVVKQSLEEKQIQLFSFDQSVQASIEEQGFGGRIAKIVCLSLPIFNQQQIHGDCLADYLSVVEANLGVNKANYFVNKSVAVNKQIGLDGVMKTDVTLSYENTNIPEVYASSPYVNYLRVFIPFGATVDSVSFNSVALVNTDLEQESYPPDKLSVGTLLRIAPGNKAVFKISYTLPALLDGKKGAYQFLYQKQPGDKLSPLVFTLNFSEGKNMNPLNFSSTSQTKNEIRYTTDTSVDRIFAIKTE